MDIFTTTRHRPEQLVHGNDGEWHGYQRCEVRMVEERRTRRTREQMRRIRSFMLCCVLSTTLLAGVAALTSSESSAQKAPEQADLKYYQSGYIPVLIALVDTFSEPNGHGFF